MLAIRMQRLGRKGHPTYRVVVQDVRQTPTSGKYVAMLGSYDPHAKTTNLVKEKAEFYLTHGAQPSERVARLFASEGITLPAWVKQPSAHTRTTRNAEKLRKNRPVEEVVAEEPATEVAETAELPADEGSTDDATEEVVDVPEAPETETSEETAVIEEAASDKESETAKSDVVIEEAPEETKKA